MRKLIGEQQSVSESKKIILSKAVFNNDKNKAENEK